MVIYLDIQLIKQKSTIIMRRFLFLFSLVLITVADVCAQNVEFKAIAPDAVIVGEQFRLTFTINAEAKDLRVQEMPDFSVLMGPSQSKSHSTRWVNGQTSSETTISYTYILIANKEGTFNIPPASIKVKNANYTSNALVVKVLPQDKAAEAASQNATSSNQVSDKDFFMRMLVSKRSVYEQEAFLVTFKLYMASSSLTPLNFKYPEFEGFLVQEIEQPQNIQVKLENYDGRNYQTAVFREVLLFPQRSGNITIEGGKYEVNVKVRNANPNRRGSIFDDFFDMTQDVKKILTTSPVNIEVKPLPSGKPAGFGNAVGNFTMTTDINATNVKANDAITVTVKINGTGNLRVIKNPEVVFPNDFEIFDPNVSINTKNTTAGVSGSKTIEYMAIPRYGGEFEIPAIAFSYFDPKAGTYKTIKSEPYKLLVERGEGEGNSPVVSNFGNRENVRVLGQDIRYLKVKGIHFETQDDIFFGSFLYYLCYLIPAILFIAFFFIYRKQVKENSNIALVRTKKANKTAVRRLKNAGKLLKENKKEEFYEEVLRALWGYLSDKLNISQAQLSKDNVEAELTKYGVNDELIKEFMDILNTCEFARYAPSQTPDAMDQLYALTADAIGKMENTIKK